MACIPSAPGRRNAASSVARVQSTPRSLRPCLAWPGALGSRCWSALGSPADALVLEARGDERVRVEEVAAVDDQRPAHPLRRRLPVKLGELAPLGDEDGGV